MKYPVMTINEAKIRQNSRTVAGLCRKHGIDVWGVTKGLSGDPRLASLYREAGFKGAADSRLRNLEKLREAGVPMLRQLMRIAMPSELEELIHTADVSLQSELSTIKALDKLCAAKGKNHDVLLMVDMGDLREGFWQTELPRAAEELRGLVGGVRLKGVATNYACASGVLPSRENMENLVRSRDRFAEMLGVELPVVSVGGTCCLKSIEDGFVPGDVNQLRLCEGVLLGTDTAGGREIPYLEHDAVTITAEIVECRHKPSVPVGETGFQAFGEKPVFINRGMRKRALLAIGRQDVNMDRITPIRRDVHIVTASSDHLIVDVTEADSTRSPDEGYKPGDTISFRPLYPAMLACATSEYVEVRFE
ncbi:MAG: alanine/ornithine racemase family PLP-dependent enzyme [Synergistaceae bacterium]|jgi:predicted amino acid racemase|nr:alanine/ornithine racemase family PLP-dependent enzyme [Synergistaceae bacterium]